MFTDDQLLPIYALQHYLFCPRQTPLIHLEQAWAENRFTAEGRVVHQTAHDGDDESRPGVRITRSIPIVSRRLGIAGQCDSCSLIDHCQPRAFRLKRGAASWFVAALASDHQTASTGESSA